MISSEPAWRAAKGPARIQPVLLQGPAGQITLAETGAPLPLERLVPGSGPWEVEIGFGKGRYLLERATAEPSVRFLGIEMASKYFRLAAQRARRRGLSNLLLIRGPALLVAATLLPRAFARAVHVYFPDPWPKSRHHKRRLFDVDTVDLVVGLMRPRGRLYFATDHLEYGEHVHEVLADLPELELACRTEPWPEGPRTNYEIKYVREGRPIVRLEARLRADEAPGLHPGGRRRLLVASPSCEPADDD